jgi:hypothetical protein
MNNPCRRTVIVALSCALAAVAASVSAQPGSAIGLGTWKLDVAKSTYSPGPPPKSQTVTYEAAGEGVKVTVELIDASGNKVRQGYTANYDGKDVPLTGSATVDTVSLKRINAHTTERTDKKAGKVVGTVTRVVAADGKTMTITTKSINAQGQPVNNVAFFVRQ